MRTQHQSGFFWCVVVHSVWSWLCRNNISRNLQSNTYSIIFVWLCILRGIGCWLCPSNIISIFGQVVRYKFTREYIHRNSYILLIFTDFYCDHCDFHFNVITVSIFFLLTLNCIVTLNEIIHRLKPN